MRALQIAATGMAAQQTRVEVISQNLANMSTTGYNARRAEFADLAYQQVTRPGTIAAADAATRCAGNPAWNLPLVIGPVAVAYTLDDVTTAPATWVPALAGIASTAGLHLWRRSIGLSLIGGTGVYVALSLLLG